MDGTRATKTKISGSTDDDAEKNAKHRRPGPNLADSSVGESIGLTLSCFWMYASVCAESVSRISRNSTSEWGDERSGKEACCSALNEGCTVGPAITQDEAVSGQWGRTRGCVVGDKFVDVDEDVRRYESWKKR